MKRLLKYQSLLWVLLMVASGGNFLHAQGIEEKAIGEANYSFDTETNKSRIETNGDLNKKDVKKARKQARKEEREKRRRARWQESNGDYQGNSGYHYPYSRRSYYHGYSYGYPYRYGSSYRYRLYHSYRHHYGRHHHVRPRSG